MGSAVSRNRTHIPPLTSAAQLTSGKSHNLSGLSVKWAQSHKLSGLSEKWAQ